MKNDTCQSQFFLVPVSSLVLLKWDVTEVNRISPQGQQGAERYMYFSTRENLGANFLEEYAPSRQTSPFQILNAETGFSQFKDPEPIKFS